MIYSREDRSECGFRSIMTAEYGVRKCASSFELAQIRSDFVVDGCSVIFFLPVFSSPFRCADQTYRRSAADLLIHVIDFSIFFIKSKHGNRIAVLIRGKDYVPAEAEIPGVLPLVPVRPVNVRSPVPASTANTAMLSCPRLEAQRKRPSPDK